MVRGDTNHGEGHKHHGRINQKPRLVSSRIEKYVIYSYIEKLQLTDKGIIQLQPWPNINH